MYSMLQHETQLNSSDILDQVSKQFHSHSKRS